jgi:phenylpyruvate tautomerase PptA (4-oxalocrotonate tautomerase family)
MPIVTITVRKPKTAEFKANVLTAIHSALVDGGVHHNDRFHRVLELDEQNFQYDARFPDVRTARTNDFILVEILLGAGRSVEVKKQIVGGVTRRLEAIGFDSENLMVCFQDVPWENWSPAGGRVPHAQNRRASRVTRFAFGFAAFIGASALSQFLLNWQRQDSVDWPIFFNLLGLLVLTITGALDPPQRRIRFIFSGIALGLILPSAFWILSR